jgi:hypothetical protein
MTYSPNIPEPSSSPKSSVTSIQTNYSQFSSVFSNISGGVTYNHMPLNDFNQGKHAAVLMQQQTKDLGIPQTQSLTVLYAKAAPAATGNNQPQLFLQIPTFLPTDLDTTKSRNIGMQLTYNSVNTSGPQYQSFLVGGYILYFGSTTNIAANIVLSPIPTKILCVQAIPQGTSTVGGQANTPYDVGVVVTQPKTIKINSTRAPGGASFLWLAIAQA